MRIATGEEREDFGADRGKDKAAQKALAGAVVRRGPPA
jgi:hypothetical protein